MCGSFQKLTTVRMAIMLLRILYILVYSTLFLFPPFCYALPTHFVYLRDIDPSIQQDIRYAGYHNFVGRPIDGYFAAECILTKPAAFALKKIQHELKKSSLSLKVYDCYRPTRAVHDFIVWSKKPELQDMKTEFYPRVNKQDFFKLGYVAEKSSHSRGSTIDLTLVPIPTPKETTYHPGQTLFSCTLPEGKRYRDNSIDMGTGYDCMDELSHALNPNIPPLAHQHRMVLRHTMIANGFAPYEEEWWHFTYEKELFPETYFNFPVTTS